MVPTLVLRETQLSGVLANVRSDMCCEVCATMMQLLSFRERTSGIRNELYNDQASLTVSRSR
jgi:hypothetical protein